MSGKEIEFLFIHLEISFPMSDKLNRRKTDVIQEP